MAFGQSNGPAASSRRVNELLELLREAGHTDFRDARGPMGFSQRQAAGKFTVDEADAFIEALLEAQHDGAPARPGPAVEPLPASARALAAFPDGQLAEELQRRGWIVVEP